MAANPTPIQPRTLEIDLRIADGLPTLVCRGRFTGDTSALLKSEVKKLAVNNKVVVADLTAVSYMDSSGLGNLLAAYVSARTNGCTLKLVNLNQRIKELLRLTQLANVFDGYGEYL